MAELQAGDRVNVDTWAGTWKVLAVRDGLVDLTRAAADPREDLRGVPVERLTLAGGLL